MMTLTVDPIRAAILEAISRRIARLKELRRGTYSRASRAFYDGAIDQLKKLTEEINSRGERQ